MAPEHASGAWPAQERKGCNYEINNPGGSVLAIEYVIMDFNGTIAVDG
jgi:hypothetical protein